MDGWMYLCMCVQGESYVCKVDVIDFDFQWTLNVCML